MPIHPCQCGVPALFKILPRISWPDQFCYVKTGDALGQPPDALRKCREYRISHLTAQSVPGIGLPGNPGGSIGTTLRYAVLLKRSVFSEGYDDLSRVYILSDQLLDGHSGFSLYVQPPG